MDINDLKTFVVVAENASFSKAAVALHVTQPAVSKRISGLEKSLDARLLDRHGKRVNLTPAGTVLLRQARHLFNVLDDTTKEIRGLSAGVQGPLALATSHHIGLHRLAPVLKQFNATYDRVQLNIAFEDSEVAHEMVRQGHVELAVATLDPAGDPRLTYHPIWHDPLSFVSATKLPTQSMRALCTMPCILPGEGTYTGKIVLERFAAAGLQLSPAMSTNYLETIGMLVHAGLGWSVLPTSMLADLHEITTDCPPMSRTLGCVTNPHRTLSNAAKAFLAVVADYTDYDGVAGIPT